MEDLKHDAQGVQIVLIVINQQDRINAVASLLLTDIKVLLVLEPGGVEDELLRNSWFIRRWRLLKITILLPPYLDFLHTHSQMLLFIVFH